MATLSKTYTQSVRHRAVYPQIAGDDEIEFNASPYISNGDGLKLQNLSQVQDLSKAIQSVVNARYSRIKQKVRYGIIVFTIIALMAWRPLELLHSFVPSLIPKLALLSGLVFIFYKLVKFSRWDDELRYVKRFFVVFLLLVIELFAENVLVWGVAYSDQRKYDRSVLGLQDNYANWLKWLGQQSGVLNWALRYKWTHTMNQMLLVLGLAFSVLWEQVPFSGFGMMSRYVLAMLLSRLVRTASFLSVVLPHPQGYGCYPRRFPPPPSTVWGFIKVGMSKLKGTGGCNDLVYSGHGTVWVLTPLVFASYARNTYVTSILWVAYIQTSIRTALEKQHYSLDMFLAGVVTALIYCAVERIYPAYNLLPERAQGQARDKLNVWVLAFIGVIILVIAILLFVAKA